MIHSYSYCSSWRFQSLFYWMLLFNRWSNPVSKSVRSVSILVLLDVALQRSGSKKCATENIEFQSLFYWMLLFNSAWGHIPMKILPVSILVLLDVALQRIDTICNNTTNMFQSLFYWMLLFNERSKSSAIHVQREFQSLFYWMLLFNRSGSKKCACENIEFQSLFYWMLLFNIAPPSMISSSSMCFNPCFTGCCSSTGIFWKDVVARSSFNPCFTGCCSSTYFFINTIYFIDVSILVLLDVALQLEYIL